MAFKPTTIYIVRHGESEYNQEDRVSGHVDPPLTQKGQQQIQRTKHVLKNVHFDAAYSSDLQRAAKTAEIIYGEPLHSFRQLEDLRERSYGPFEGKPNQHLDPVHEKRTALSEEEGWSYKHVPEMESEKEVAERFVASLIKLAKNHPGETLLVGSHGTALRVMLMHLNGLSYKDFSRGSIGNGDYVKLVYDGKQLKVDEVVHLDN